MKSQIFALLLAVLIGIAYAQKNVTVVCTSCPISTCASGFCFTITGSSFNETLCVSQGKKCSTGVNTQIQLNNCSVDYSSTSCNRGICLYTLNPVALLGATCDAQYTEAITCGTCVANAGCGSSFCQGVLKSPNTNAQIGCVNYCPNPANTTRNVQACANGFDAIGGQNKCCMTFVNTSGPVCITQNSFLAASAYIDSYILGTKSNFQQQIKSVILVSILCIVAMIF